MNAQMRWIAMVLLFACCTSAQAAATLTAAECHDYPFVRPTGEVTHAQLMRELSELEAVGYNPGGDEVNYPDDLQEAEQTVHQEYLRDCAVRAPR